MTETKSELSGKKLILGIDNTIKKMRQSKVKKVYVSSNCHKREELIDLGKLTGIEVVVVGENSADLGTLCKKPFSISVVSVQ